MSVATKEQVQDRVQDTVQDAAIGSLNGYMNGNSQNGHSGNGHSNGASATIQNITVEEVTLPSPKKMPFGIIDCDMHHNLPKVDALFPYLPRKYVEQIQDFGPMMPGMTYTNVPGSGCRDDLWHDYEHLDMNPSAVPEVAREAHMDIYNVAYGILTGGATGGAAVHPNPDYASAYCSAFNDYTLEYWSGTDPRLKSSIHISPQDPDLAVAEIERLGDRPEIAQVMMPAGARMPYGNRFYHPIYAACEAYNLPVCIHFGAEGGGVSAPPTAAGYPTYYLEMRMARPQIAMAHVTSLICEGVFEKFPNFKFLFIEHDTFWVSGLMWHMDTDWKGLRDYTPWVKKLPSEYLRSNIRFGSQPMPNTPTRADLEKYLEWMWADEVMVFASDYPHWDWDEPNMFLAGFDKDFRRRVMYENAKELYRF
ncbi:MAG: amidohydrolase family protein [Chloroflexota bacterium]